MPGKEPQDGAPSEAKPKGTESDPVVPGADVDAIRTATDAALTEALDATHGNEPAPDTVVQTGAPVDVPGQGGKPVSSPGKPVEPQPPTPEGERAPGAKVVEPEPHDTVETGPGAPEATDGTGKAAAVVPPEQVTFGILRDDKEEVVGIEVPIKGGVKRFTLDEALELIQQGDDAENSKRFRKEAEDKLAEAKRERQEAQRLGVSAEQLQQRDQEIARLRGELEQAKAETKKATRPAKPGSRPVQTATETNEEYDVRVQTWEQQNEAASKADTEDLVQDLVNRALAAAFQERLGPYEPSLRRSAELGRVAEEVQAWWDEELPKDGTGETYTRKDIFDEPAFNRINDAAKAIYDGMTPEQRQRTGPGKILTAVAQQQLVQRGDTALATAHAATVAAQGADEGARKSALGAVRAAFININAPGTPRVAGEGRPSTVEGLPDPNKETLHEGADRAWGAALEPAD